MDTLHLGKAEEYQEGGLVFDAFIEEVNSALNQ